VGDISRDYYRTKQEEQKWKTERDPIKILGDWLIEQNLADRAALDTTHAEVKQEIDKAVQFALASPYPAIDKVTEDVYA
jgi:pyruvate dehydrogenase E1 component alpha subunit